MEHIYELLAKLTAEQLCGLAIFTMPVIGATIILSVVYISNAVSEVLSIKYANADWESSQQTIGDMMSRNGNSNLK